MRRDLKDVKPGIFADTAKGFEFGRCEEPPEGPYGRSQGQQEGERQGEQLCCFALTEGFPGHRTFSTKPGYVPGKLGLNWSPRGRARGQRGCSGQNTQAHL